MTKKKTRRIIGISVAAIVVIIVAALAYVMLMLPNIPVPEMQVKSDPARIAHGKYLANHVMVCIDCHSARDWSRFSGPVTPGTEGRGGEKFDQSMDFPGVFYAKNITPYNLDDWTDGEIFRAITSGVTRDKKVIFPVMPYPNYGKMDANDIRDVIAYIRTLPSIKYDVPESDPDFPMNIIMHTIPEKPDTIEKPSPSDTLKYGEYIVRAGACFDCHTKFEDGKYNEAMAFAGGNEFILTAGIVRAANITPDKTTGIGTLDQQAFLNRFKAYDERVNTLASTGPRDFNSIMPWSMYAEMEESDLRSVYRYLSSITPISNKVEKFTPLK